MSEPCNARYPNICIPQYFVDLARWDKEEVIRRVLLALLQENVALEGMRDFLNDILQARCDAHVEAVINKWIKVRK